MQPAQSRKFKEATGPTQFVVFSLGREKGQHRDFQMAVNVQKVKELVEVDSISTLPANCYPLYGLLDLRGTPVPILDVQSFFDLEVPAIEGHRRLRLMVCELEGLWVAFQVGKVNRLHQCDPSDFLPPPDAKTAFITGVLRRDGSYTPVIDLDSILTQVRGARDSQKISVREARFAGKRAFLIDDSRVMLKRIEKLFQKIGFEYDLATNGQDALERLQKSERKYDLIFTDIEMPVLDGISMARKLRSDPRFAKVAILFNSALSNPALIRDVREEKLGEYIVKYDEDVILRQLEVLFPESKE